MVRSNSVAEGSCKSHRPELPIWKQRHTSRKCVCRILQERRNRCRHQKVQRCMPPQTESPSARIRNAAPTAAMQRKIACKLCENTKNVPPSNNAAAHAAETRRFLVKISSPKL